MFRVIGAIVLLALCASASFADEDRAAYTREQAKLTEELNAVIARGVGPKAEAPPAKPAEPSDPRVAKSERVSS
jgi:hypothetical protein